MKWVAWECIIWPRKHDPPVRLVEEVVGGSVSKLYVYGRTPLRSGDQSYVSDGHTVLVHRLFPGKLSK